MGHNKQARQGERGNVLFLILIAVALFAALSYVVTQSTRSGTGSTEREKNILSSAQMTQYPTALRTGLIRMVLSGMAIENIRFDAPTTSGFTAISASLQVFHPQGGGAAYQDGPAELSATTGGPIPWRYNANFIVPGIGLDIPGGGNDVIAFLPGVAPGICRQVNEQLSIRLGSCTPDVTGGIVPRADTTVTTNSALLDQSMTAVPNVGIPTTGHVLQCAGGTAFTRQAAGCFFDSTGGGRYVFYSVLLER